MRRLLIVIPALNEEQALPSLIDEVLCAGADLPCSSEVVVVDDGSTDNTAVVTEKRGVRVVRLCRNLGIGGAVQTGLRMAYREGFDCAVQVDGDGQHPPSEIVRLLDHLRQASPPDIVVGSRRLELRGYQSTPARRLGQLWLRLWLYLICRLRITDPTSGFRLYGPRALALFQQTYAYDFPEPESLAVACAGAPSRRAIGRDAAAPGRAFQHRGVHVRLLHDQGDARRRAHLPEDRETRADDPAHCATVHLDAENELRGTRR